MLTKCLPGFLIVTIIALSVTVHSFAQGIIPGKKKSFLGALVFMENSVLAAGYSSVKMGMPRENDPMVDPKEWYNGGNVQMRGMMGDAVLFLEWWAKSSSPAERYKFDWTSSGYFELYNLSDNPTTRIKRINRADLTKYPNLLKRFDDITPIDIQFEFSFHTGGIPDQAYADFRKRYKIMEDLGSAGYAVSYNRKLDGDFILYKPSRRKQDWINPGPIPGGWDTFLNMPDKYEDKKSRLIELFKLGDDLVISSFKISSIKWRMSDFEYIARKFNDYETGKDKPTAFDEVADGEKKNKAGDESWDETDLVDSETEIFRDEQNSKYGIRSKKGRVLKEGQYDRMEKNEKDKFYIASKGNMVFILNNMGAEVYSKILNAPPEIGKCANGNFWVTETLNKEKMGGHNYYITTGNKYIFHAGKLARSYKWYSGFYPPYIGSLIVSSGEDNRSSQQKEADRRRAAAEEKRREDDLDRMVAQKTNALKGSGYTAINAKDCD